MDKSEVITIEDAWNKLFELYLTCDKDVLADIIIAYMQDGCGCGNGLSKKGLEVELANEFGGKWTVVDDTEAAKLLYGQK